MTVLEIAKAIVEFGVTPVFLACLIGAVAWLGVSWNKDKDKQDTDKKAEQEQIASLMKSVSALTSTVADMAKTSYPVHTKENEDSARKYDVFLNNQLQELRDNTNASRAMFVAYHNGGAMINGAPFTRCSMQCEKLDVKTKPVISDYQNWHRSIISDLCSILAEKGEFFCGDTTQIHDNASRAILTTMKAETFYCVAVVDNINDIIVGFVSVQFSHKTEFNEDIIKELHTVANAIGGATQLLKND